MMTRRAVEAAPPCFAIRPLRERGGQRVGGAAGRALDGGVVADRPRVAFGEAVGVACFRRPHGDELDLAGLGRAVGLLAAPAFHLGLAHRHAGAVQPQVQRPRHAGGGLDHRAFVGRDLASQRFGNALDLFGVDRHAGQFPHLLARFGEADARRRRAHHPRGGGRKRRVVQAQRQVSRIQARPAGGAVVIGAFERHRPEHGRERLLIAAGIAGRLAAGARYRWPLVVRSVRVPPALCPPGGGPEHQAAAAMLKGFEVHAVGPAEIQQRVEFGADRDRERVIEALFF